MALPDGRLVFGGLSGLEAGGGTGDKERPDAFPRPTSPAHAQADQLTPHLVLGGDAHAVEMARCPVEAATVEAGEHGLAHDPRQRLPRVGKQSVEVVTVEYAGERRPVSPRPISRLCCKLGEGAMRDQGASCSPYDSALARRSCSHAMASVRAHGPRPKARSTIRASPTMPPWRANIPAWPLRSARITSKPLIVA